jgi:hypothetical protein
MPNMGIMFERLLPESVMDDNQIQSHVNYYATRYPSLICVAQAMEIADVTRKTIYHWSSTGKLDGFKAKQGRHIRLSRDQFVRFLLESKSNPQ